ncbi:MAG: hypothetical protein WCF85_16455 [Rhodospirillaceae bacterium]
MLSKVSIKIRLSVAFALLVGLSAILGSVAFQSVDTLATVTGRLYKHPFTVTNALAAANGTQQVTAAIGNVARAMDETGRNATDVLSGVEALGRQANMLDRKIDGFLQKIRV